MYCRQCGNKLLDNDKFCNKCGVKIVTDADSLVSQENNSFATSDYNSANHSAMKSFMDYSIVKFFIYSVAFLVIVLVVRSPHDLLGTFCYQLGRAIGIFIFVLPILWALSESKILIKSHKMEGFFLIALVDTLTISIFVPAPRPKEPVLRPVRCRRWFFFYEPRPERIWIDRQPFAVFANPTKVFSIPKSPIM